MLLRRLEQHVFEQVRHPGLAVALMLRSDEDRHVDRDLRLRRLRKQHDLQPVRQLVLGEAFHAGNLLRLGSLIRPSDCDTQTHQTDQTNPTSKHESDSFQPAMRATAARETSRRIQRGKVSHGDQRVRGLWLRWICSSLKPHFKTSPTRERGLDVRGPRTPHSRVGLVTSKRHWPCTSSRARRVGVVRSIGSASRS